MRSRLGNVWAPLAGALSLLAVCSTPVLAAGDDQETLGDKTIDELIVELERRGVVTATPSAAEEAQTTPPVDADAEAQDETLKALIEWFERVDLYGDFRGRFEGFVYDNGTNDRLSADTRGSTRDPKDRYRWRYRLRFGAKIDLNDYFDTAFRLATGPDANSANQTLGSGFDWDPDDVFVDQAYVTGKPFGTREMPLQMDGYARLGKMPNPFISKKGDDIMIFDDDITPEGLALSWSLVPVDGVTANLDLAYYIVEEISGRSADPHFLAAQLDLAFQPTDTVGFGVSPSHYTYRNLDQEFFERGTFAADGLGASYGGNVPNGGLSVGNDVQVTDVRAWVEFKGVKPWPMMVYGNYLKNHSARNTSGFNAGKEDSGWSLGTQMGDKKKNVQLSAAYFELGANATPANFVDSDLFDGRTNGKGWHFKVARQIFANTDLKADLYVSEPLKNDVFGPATITTGPASGQGASFYNEAVRNHERIRFRLDVVVAW